MKKQDIEIAKQKILNLIGKSLQQDIPTLDYVMGVQNMSETDKIFYNAYKKYGNRNHTWQDFKLMFNGDVKTMQETIKHWKTWDEIHNVFYNLSVAKKRLIQLSEKYKIKTLDELKSRLQDDNFKQSHQDLLTAYENYLVLQSQNHVNYTTFDLEVAQIAKEFSKAEETAKKTGTYTKLKQDYTHRMSELVDLRNIEFVIGERIEIYTKILMQNSELLNQCKNFNQLSTEDRIQFAKQLLTNSSKLYGLPRPKFEINNDSDGDIQAAYEKQTDTYVFYYKKLAKIQQAYPLLRFIAHEEAHRIDYKNPNYGIVGEQTMNFADKILLEYSQTDYDTYLEAATEQSSHLIEDYIAGAVVYKISRREN